MSSSFVKLVAVCDSVIECFFLASFLCFFVFLYFGFLVNYARVVTARIVGFSKRRTGSGTGAKYINSLDSEVFKKGELFFNLNRIAKRIKDDKKIYLCEGYFDCMSAHQQGLNCVAYIGGAITKTQIALMHSLETLHKGITYILASDNDPTGEKEIIALREKIKKYNMNLNLRVYSFPQEEFEFLMERFAESKISMICMCLVWQSQIIHMNTLTLCTAENLRQMWRY